MNDSGTDKVLQRVADQFGTPAYVYFADRIAARIALLEQAFENRFTLSFAVKCNPNPALLAWLHGKIDHLDISSAGELRLALAAGWEPSRITFTGPGKQEFEIAEAVACGVGALVIESEGEAALANTIATATGRCQDIVVRVAPDVVPKGFGDQMAGRPSPFGIDIEVASAVLPRILALPGLRMRGFHIYSGTQCLKPEAIAENYRTFLAIFEALCGEHQLTPEMLIMGSGLGVPYQEQDSPLDVGEVARSTVSMLDSFQAAPRFSDTAMVLELGRYLVAECGYYLTRVTSTKDSRGVRFGICDGGMNHHLPASGNFGMVIRRNYRLHKVGGDGEAQAASTSSGRCARRSTGSLAAPSCPASRRAT